MIMVTGGTGFIGRVLLRHFASEGLSVRTLLRPKRSSPRLPRGVAVDVTLASLTDQRGIRASLVGVDTVVHLASAEASGDSEALEAIDIEGTRTLAACAVEAGIRRLVYLSHLGADRSSAYPVMRAKAVAEEAIRRSGVPFTILRTAVTYGEGDHLTTSTAMALAVSPVFFLPGGGTSLLQPLWVEDLATCITWLIEDPQTLGRTYEIGGPEFLTYEQVVGLVMQASGIHRVLLSARPPYLRMGAWLMSHLLPWSPWSTFWLDYLAVNHTCGLDELPRVFKLQASRMEDRLRFLRGRSWTWELIRRQFRRGEKPR